jgi:hypothetical protein
MTTEFGGEPVTGGTLPALIWKSFVASVGGAETAGSFTAPPYLGGSSTWVVRRGGTWKRDNGYCRGARLVVYFSDKVPRETADCKPNEVQVPEVVGMTADSAAARLAEQPLGASFVYKPARPGSPTGIVVDQIPRHGGLSANDDVTLVVSKAVAGLVPNFVGSNIQDVSRVLQDRHLRVVTTTAPGPVGTVLRQSPRAGVAAGPGLTIKLVVADGSRKARR